MIQKLYINNELVDLSENTSITLNFKSNIFGDVSKITASNSQTINLPKTTRNRRIFDNASAPAYNSRFPYVRHTCRYEQNGVELINGYAVMLSSADTYEIALYWGVLDRYQGWVDANPSLRDLEGDEFRQWDSSITAVAYNTFLNSGYGYAHYDMLGNQYGKSVKISKSLRNIHPSVSVRWLLNKIEAQQGLSFVFSNRLMDDVRQLILPCVTTNAGERYWSEAKLTATAELHIGTQSVQLVALDVVAPEYITVENREISGFDGSRTYFGTAGADKVRFTFKDFTSGRYKSGSVFNVRVRTTDGSTNIGYEFNTTTNSGGVVGFDLSQEISVEGMDEVYFFISNHSSATSGTWRAEAFTYTPLVSENAYPCAYDIMPNVPDITQIDFIKALCVMLGAFAMPDKDDPNAIQFVGVDDLIANKATAIDWTDRLIGEQGADPQESLFSINDWAQDNWFRYTEDESVIKDADYSLKVANESLERERDVATLPFSASDDGKILQYDINVNDAGVASVELRDVKPRIMRLYNAENGEAAMRFLGLSFKELLSSYYAGYSAMLNNAVVIKEKLHLSEFDIKDIDFTKPIYLAQYGRYFGLVSLQVSGAKCTAELAMLPA